MKMNVQIGIFLAIFLFSLPQPSQSSDLVYRPVNPAFGGSYLNGSFLLDSANAQNKLVKKKNPVEDFEAQLTRRILGNLARKITKSTFSDDIAAGEYTLGDIFIEIGDSADGVDVTITDYGNGGSTNIVIPNY